MKFVAVEDKKLMNLKESNLWFGWSNNILITNNTEGQLPLFYVINFGH